MQGSAQDSREFDAFAMRLIDIDAIDVTSLHALSISVGWPHRAEDWAFLRQVGQGVAVLDEIDRVLGSAMWFPHGADFATIGMVIISPRLQTLGAGRWLMRRVFSSCEGRSFRLNATRAARQLYRSLKFKPERTVFQFQGEARRPETMPAPPDAGDLRPLRDADLAAVIDLDARGFGVARSQLIPALFEQSVGYGLFRAGRLEAFSLCRRFGRGRVVGPVVADRDRDAICVVAPHVEAAEGSFLRIDTQREHGEFTAFLAGSGLPVFDTVLTMSLKGDAPDRDRSGRGTVTYALASQALG